MRMNEDIQADECLKTMWFIEEYRVPENHTWLKVQIPYNGNHSITSHKPPIKSLRVSDFNSTWVFYLY